ncbi:hypothetical protein MAM1_0053c03489 [Mucor ambiguus]|uniref:Uncharacterized protein n=1 Tax=Mucor ambiguus TaxID=91626 RepID=A0A0C9M495_9FUNG|nr:hypothetical protein MAM1_0053c03489 [Mucor ambiguus]
MKEAQQKLGRLVQCSCSLCDGNQQGFQWILPRTKSKHVLYEKTMNKKQEQDLDVIQQKLAFISINHDGMVKKKKMKPAFRISLALQRKLNRIGYNETIVVLKEFTVTSSSTSAALFAISSQDNIPVTDYY